MNSKLASNSVWNAIEEIYPRVEIKGNELIKSPEISIFSFRKV